MDSELLRQGAFFTLASIMLVGSAGVICFRRPVYSALSLLIVILGTAAIFASLDAHFLALAQVMLYGGAIAVLFLFLIMLIGAGKERFNIMSLFYWSVALLLTIALGLMLMPDVAALKLNVTEDASFGIKELGNAIFAAKSNWLFVLEVTGALLTASMVAAVVLALGKKEPTIKYVEEKK